MKWKKVYLLGDASEFILRRNLFDYKNRYCIPDNRCLMVTSSELQGGSLFQKWNVFRCRFQDVDRDSKLIILCHGDTDNLLFGGRCFPPEHFILILKLLGIREVGLVSFKSCLAGAGNFLDRFVTEAGVKGLNVGWAIGYRSSSFQFPFSDRSVSGFAEFFARSLTLGYAKFSDSWRVKVVRGNIAVRPLILSSRFPDK